MTTVTQTRPTVKTIVADTTPERWVKGDELYRAGHVEKYSADVYVVQSQVNDNGRYLVNLAERTCTCPDHKHRGMFCKHLHAALMCELNEFPHDISEEWVSFHPGAVTAHIVCACGNEFTQTEHPTSSSSDGAIHIARSEALAAWGKHVAQRIKLPVCAA